MVKGSSYIEQLAKTSIIAFDKTGTLTRGELEVDDVIGADPDDVVKCAATLESQSTHPIAKAITEKSESLGQQKEAATAFKNYPGLGVKATCNGEMILVGNTRLYKELGINVEESIVDGNGKTAVIVSRNGTIIGSISLTDKIRLESCDSVAAFRRRGIQVEMLTGDNESTAKERRG